MNCNKCNTCGKFCKNPADCGIPYGCNYSYDGPEPLDEEFFCDKCAEKKQSEYEKAITDNGEGDFRFCNWWQVPMFVKNALDKTGYSMKRDDRNTKYILTKETN